MEVWVDYIPWVYLSIQGIIAIVVSIVGVKYVRMEYTQVQKIGGVEQHVELQVLQPSTKKSVDQPAHWDGHTEEKEEKLSQERFDGNDTHEQLNKMGFCKLWLKIVWKMRTVYSSLAVHIFDVLTDVLVIVSWINYPDIKGDGVDPPLMAYSAICVLMFHKVMSFIAFWAKERDIIRCLLQFFDLLIFQEIYLSHKRIITQLKTKNGFNDNIYSQQDQRNQAIETTQTFKFVRNLEAIFESIPQSVLQLVFIIRTAWKSEGSGIFLVISLLSILQSITSMTNSILGNDNIYMTLPKWSKYKQRFPPTWSFFKHAISRLSEVVYRICLCALFWTVCGGLPFGILICAELLALIVFVGKYDINMKNANLNIEDLCLRLQALIIMPSELVYDLEFHDFNDSFVDWHDGQGLMGICDLICCGLWCGIFTCCFGPSVLLSRLGLIRDKFYVHMTLRIGISMLEWGIIIVWPLIINQDTFKFLYSLDYGLAVFITSIICYLIYTQYLWLFPNFTLPYNIPVRSHYGYAFNGELEELQRYKIPKPKSNVSLFNWNDDDNTKSKLPWSTGSQVEEEISLVQQILCFCCLPDKPKKGKDESDPYAIWTKAFHGDLEGLMEIYRKKKSDKFDGLPPGYDNSLMTPAMLALSNKHFDVVQWLEDELGANKHKEIFKQQYEFEEMDHLFARVYLDPFNWPESKLWDKPYNNTICVTPVLLALSNKQYHIVEWLVKERDAKLPTLMFERQTEFDFMDFEFARTYIGNEFFNSVE